MLAEMKQEAIEVLMGLPIVKQHFAAAEEKKRATLQEAQANIVAIDKKEAIDIAAAHKNFAAATKEAEAAQQELLAKLESQRVALNAMNDITHRAQVARNRNQAILAAGNANATHAWREKLATEAARLRSDSMIIREEETKTDRYGWSRCLVTKSNRESIVERLLAVVSAQRAVEQLRVTVADINPEMQKLWNTFPQIEMRATGN